MEINNLFSPEPERELSNGERIEKFRSELRNHIIFQIRRLQSEGNIDSEINALNSLINSIAKASSFEELKRIQAEMLDITENRNLR
ncbi:MAG: hypothetical protein PHQ18_02590 [Patescibacteria group bacterium]|nr:hypothetical protein [Patescibacteria group bacterium]